MNALRRGWRWMAVVLPPRSICITLVLGYLWLRQVGGQSFDGDPTQGIICTGFLLAVFAVFGAFRVSYFHPSGRPGYVRWLATTPWRHPQPLPFGPVRLDLRDGILMMLGAALIAFEGRGSPLFVFIATIAGYVIYAHFRLLGRHPWRPLRISALLGAAVLLMWFPWLCLAVLLLAYVEALRGIDDTLVRLGRAPGPPVASSGAGVGPLHSQLGPTPAPDLPSLPRATAIAALAAWWTFIAFDLMQRGGVQTPGLLWMIVIIVAGLALLRLTVTKGGCAAPISLRGRLATGRWILPGHDVVLLAPLVCLVLGWLPPVLAEMGLGPSLAAAIGVGAAVFAALAIPPSPRRFALTGQHRIRAATPGRSLQIGGLDMNAEIG